MDRRASLGENSLCSSHFRTGVVRLGPGDTELDERLRLVDRRHQPRHRALHPVQDPSETECRVSSFAWSGGGPETTSL